MKVLKTVNTGPRSRQEDQDVSLHWRNLGTKVHILNTWKKPPMWKQSYFTAGTKTLPVSLFLVWRFKSVSLGH